MEKRSLFSPAAECDDTFQETRAPDWYSIIKIAVRSILALVLSLSVFFTSISVKAAELPSGGLESFEENEALNTSVSSGDGIIVPDETVYYIPGSVVESLIADEEELFPVYESYEEFMTSPLYVTRYENEILKKLEFCQYALAIQIALLFLLIFKKK